MEWFSQDERVSIRKFYLLSRLRIWWATRSPAPRSTIRTLAVGCDRCGAVSPEFASLGELKKYIRSSEWTSGWLRGDKCPRCTRLAPGGVRCP